MTNEFFCTKFCPCDLGWNGEEDLAKNVWQCKNKEAKAHMVQLNHMLSEADLTGEDISKLEKQFQCSGICDKEPHYVFWNSTQTPKSSCQTEMVKDTKLVSK